MPVKAGVDPSARRGPPLAAISPQSSATAPPRRSRTTILVSRPVYVFCWWFVLALHLTVGIFVLFTGFSHLVLSIPAVHVATMALRISIPLKRLSGISYVLVALLHFRALGRMVHRSIAARRLILGRHEAQASRPIVQPPKQKSKRPYIVRYIVRVWLKVFGPDGYLRIDGPYFAGSMAFRECVEVVMQTYQAQALSHAVARPWINQFAVASVVLNCWSSTAVRVGFAHHSVAASRLLHVVVDMYLDIVFGIVLPVCVMLRYALAFDWSTGSYPPSLMLDDVWVANGIAESRQVLVTSYLDYVASLLPQYGIFSCLTLLKKLLRRYKSPAAAPTATSLAAIVPTTDPATASVVALPHVKESRAVRVASVCMAVWGAVVLGLHVRAQAIAATSFEGCYLQPRPWFASNVSCSIMYLNCPRRGTDGSGTELHDILSKLHRPALTRVIFAHCAALTVPFVFTKFPAMYSVEIYNCTLVDWSVSAAVSQDSHPELMIITIGRSDVRAVPPALLHNRLPKSLSVVGFYNCTLAELPDDIGDVWAGSSISLLALERTRVRRLPSSLGRVRWQVLWFAGSLIEDLPDNILANSPVTSLWLSGNPIKSLPSTIGSTTQLAELFVEDTNVSSLPLWVTDWMKAHQQTDTNCKVSFTGSPICVQHGVVYKDRGCGQDLGSRHGVANYDYAATKYPL